MCKRGRGSIINFASAAVDAAGPTIAAYSMSKAAVAKLTHILAAEGDSKWTFFNGNYQEYEADKKKRLGEEAAKPKRLRFKPLK